MNPDVRAKLEAKFGAVRTGGKGTVRRKKKAFRKSATQDDKRLQITLKKLNVNPIPAIEEVNMFGPNGTVVHFDAPNVQAAIAANTYVVSGQAENKSIQELLPEILPQLGHDSIQNLKNIAASYQQQHGAAAAEDDDDDVPDLVENFDAPAAADEIVPEGTD